MNLVFKCFLSTVFFLNVSVNTFAGTHSFSSTNDLRPLDLSILPENIKDPSIIYIKESLINNERFVSINFCSDRTDQKTCTLLGGKSFSIASLKKYSDYLKQDRTAYLERLKSLSADSYKKQNIVENTQRFLLVAVYVVSVILVTIFTGPGSLAGASVVSLLSLIPGGLVINQGINWDSFFGLDAISYEYKKVYAMAYNELHTANEMLQSPNRAYPDLHQVAESLHKFLIEVENYTNKSRLLSP